MLILSPVLAGFALVSSIVVLSRTARVSSRMRQVARASLVVAMAALAVVSCGREVTAPGSEGRLARGISFLAMFPKALEGLASASEIVDFARVRVTFRRADHSIAFDTIVNYGSTDPGDRQLSISIRLSPSTPPSGETMQLFLSYVNATGDTVFRGGPSAVTVVPTRPGAPASAPVQVAVRYTGPGANAQGVVIAPRSLSVGAGDGFTLTAKAVDGNGGPIANTPIIWRSLDTTVARLGSASAGTGTARLARGPARIVAQLITGQADTVPVTVTPKFGGLAAVSGSGQRGAGGQQLPLPVVVKATATDGLPLAGVAVTFAASTGGSVGAASVVTDAAGLAQTTWKLALELGPQSLTATTTGLATPVAFTATSTSGPPAKLAITTQPVDGTAGVPLAPVVVTVQDAAGNTASYNGTVTMTLGTAPSGVPLLGTVSVTAVNGVATFDALRVRRAATGYTLVASAPSLTSATTTAFAIGAAPAFALSLQSGSGDGGTAGTLLPSPIVALVTDSCGNPVAGQALTFRVTAGGGSVVPTSATTGADGTASTRWTLGPDAGFQFMSIAGVGLTPPSVGAVANAIPLAGLQFVQQPTNATAGIVLSPAITVQGTNSAGALDTLFNGTVTLAFGNNPTGATLGGTLTQTAYRGVATFGDIRIRKSGTSYTLAASASGRGGATSAAFNITTAPAATVTVVSGSGQTGATGATLANPLVALVSDSAGNPVSGATVAWATSSGSVSPASSTTGSNGTASATWTLGVTGGAGTATATVGALTPATFTATVTAPPAAYSKTWTGAVDTDWANAGNWNPSGVPTTGDSTLIPVTTNQPVLMAAASIGKLTVASGATLNMNGQQLTAYGPISSPGLISAGTGGWLYGMAALSLSGNFALTSLYVQANSTLGGAFNNTGNLVINGGGPLALNNNTLTNTGNLTAWLKMVNAADSVNVTGSFTVNNANSVTNLTAGTIVVVGGNFVQTSMYQTFPARGTHKVVMKGTTAAQHIQFYFSTNRYSHFNDLVIDNPYGVIADSVNFDNGGGTMYGGITEVARHLTILNGTFSGARGTYLRLGGTLTDAVGGRVTLPKIYFDSSATPIAAGTTVLSAAKVYFDGVYNGTALVGGKRASLQDNLTINGDLYIQGSDTLKVNGHTLTVTGLVSQSSSAAGGMFEMTNSADVVNVSGASNLLGYPHAGIYTAGTYNAGGAFTANVLQASGTHKVVLKGAGSYGVYIGTADSTSGSFFQNLDIANTAADTLLIGGSVLVRGTLSKSTATATVFAGQNSLPGVIYANGINMTQAVTWNRVPLYLYGSGALTLSNATFNNDINVNGENPQLGGTQQWHLTVSRPAGGSFTFGGLTFSLTSSLPTPGGNIWGFANIVGPPSLNVSLTTATPSAAGGGTAKSQTSGGATLSWSP